MRVGRRRDAAELTRSIARFESDKREAALGFWYEIHKGILGSLKEF